MKIWKIQREVTEALGARGPSKWHDLEKDPNDLPPTDPLYENCEWKYSAPLVTRIKVENWRYYTNICYYNFNTNHWFYWNDEGLDANVVAWREDVQDTRDLS